MLWALAVYAAVTGAGCKNTARTPATNAVLPAPVARTGITRAHERSDPPSGARPKAGPVAESHLAADLRFLGSVPFDSVTLPLVAMRSGRHGQEFLVVTQHGQPPAWPTLLAAPATDSPPPSTWSQLTAFRASASPSSTARERRTLEAIAWSTGLPRGVLLGRSCNDRGFLVEWPRADRSRWIGLVGWETGDVRWLVQGRDTSAFATIGPAGEIAYSRRIESGASNAADFALVLRPSADAGAPERVLSMPNVSLVFPTFSADREHVYALAVNNTPGSRLRVIAAGTRSGAPSSSLRVAFEATLNAESTIFDAFRATVCTQTPWPVAIDGPLAHGFAVGTGDGEFGWFAAPFGASFKLASGSFAAVPWIHSGGNRADGLLLGAPGQLAFQPLRAAKGSESQFDPETSVFNSGFIPRVVGSDGKVSYLLLAPPATAQTDAVGVYEYSPREVR